jgi:hypothetical protein
MSSERITYTSCRGMGKDPSVDMFPFEVKDISTQEPKTKLVCLHASGPAGVQWNSPALQQSIRDNNGDICKVLPQNVGSTCVAMGLFSCIAICNALPLLFLYLCYSLVTRPCAWSIVTAVCLLASLGIPLHVHTWPGLVQSTLWEAWRWYFSFQVYAEVPEDFKVGSDEVLRGSEDHIIAAHPHGAFPMGGLYHVGYMYRTWC